MKTVKEIAFDLEVSQVTVYNHIKKLDKELKGNIFKVQGVTKLDDEGIRQLKISMGLIQVPQVKEYVSTEDIIKDISDLVTEMVSDNIKQDILKAATDTKKDYEDLSIQIKQLEEQNRALMELIEDKQGKTLLGRLRGLFKG